MGHWGSDVLDFRARRAFNDRSVVSTPSPAIAEKRRGLAPETERASQTFSRQVFADAALSAKTKRLIAVAVALVT